MSITIEVSQSVSGLYSAKVSEENQGASGMGTMGQDRLKLTGSRKMMVVAVFSPIQLHIQVD